MTLLSPDFRLANREQKWLILVFEVYFSDKYIKDSSFFKFDSLLQLVNRSNSQDFNQSSSFWINQNVSGENRGFSPFSPSSHYGFIHLSLQYIRITQSKLKRFLEGYWSLNHDLSTTFIYLSLNIGIIHLTKRQELFISESVLRV